MKSVLVWLARIIPAVILIQTLFFKFSGAEESVWIFTTLGVEPWGRIGSGVVELIAAALILIPATSALGGLLAANVMAGALLSHVFILGVQVKDDGGLLFGLALIVLVFSLILVFTHFSQVQRWRHSLLKR